MQPSEMTELFFLKAATWGDVVQIEEYLSMHCPQHITIASPGFHTNIECGLCWMMLACIFYHLP